MNGLLKVVFLLYRTERPRIFLAHPDAVQKLPEAGAGFLPAACRGSFSYREPCKTPPVIAAHREAKSQNPDVAWILRYQAG
jgi:hypothetical protein